jgi:hypothetical protein
MRILIMMEGCAPTAGNDPIQRDNVKPYPGKRDPLSALGVFITPKIASRMHTVF